MEQWIILSGLKVPVSIGIHEFEKRGPQEYRMSINLGVGPDYIVATDSIGEALDYDKLRRRVVEYVQSGHFNTQEYLAQGVIEIAFEIDRRVLAVEVTVEKTTVYPDCDAVGLRYRAGRMQWAAAVVRSKARTKEE